MKIGIANEETWEFMNDIHVDLRAHHTVSVFKRRMTRLPVLRERRNRALFQEDLSRFLTRNQVVFFEWASELLSYATQLPKTCGIVVRLHRYEMYKWVETINWDRVDKIILVSHAKQNEFNQRFPEQAHKTVVINVAVPLDKFTFEPHPYTGQIGTLCHITPRKRVYDLILDFYGLLQDQAGSATKFHLHIGGDIHPSYLDYSQAMQDLIERLGMRDAVTFHGKVTEPWNWYHQLDIFVSHSYSEGLQVAPMEAMASGCYCLSHHWAGAEEMLPVENLYVTGEELREKILAFDRLASEEQLAQRAASRAMAQQNFDVDKNKRLVRELIEQVGEKFLP